MTDRDPAFTDWVRAGQAVKVVAELSRRSHMGRLKRSGHELVGPCPLCGGHDRFGVHPHKDVWHCRRCDAGGDAIALVQHLDGVDFMQAIERLTGEPTPGHAAGESAADRVAREARQRAVIAKAEADERAREAKSAEFRERERIRAHDIWRRGRGPVASPVEAYLKLRRLTVPAGAMIRVIDALKMWDAPPPRGKVVHCGPAMVSGIVGPDGRFSGVHMTWIDLGQPNGKALVPDAETGEFLPAKKVRGSKSGGSILLGAPPAGKPARVLFLGEGIETVLSIRAALMAADLDILQIAEFRSSVDLGNLSGPAVDRVAHPTLTRVDKRDRRRRLMVPGAIPELSRKPMIPIGPAIEDIVLIGDGDSEPFTTRLAMERAAARFSAAYPYVTVKLVMAAEGVDFNDMWQALAPDIKPQLEGGA